MNTYDKVLESNDIESIFREPTPAEVAEHDRFCYLEEVDIGDLIEFVNVYQPGARLRNRPGMDVQVGNFLPPEGSPEVPRILQGIVEAATNKLWTPWEVHTEFECLHPFTDGNGRLGRVLWWWSMRGDRKADLLGFLHSFYYQTLQNYEDNS